MRLTDIRTVVVNAEMRNWVFVRVETDDPGLYGWGEATVEWKTRAVVGAVEDLKPLLIGQDPRDIENAFRILTKHGFWKLGVIGYSAVSGIEIALWDIFAKSLGVPVWRLLGGRVRNRIPVYTHLGIGQMEAVYGRKDPARLAQYVTNIRDKGYRAFKALFPLYMHYTISPAERRTADAWMRQLREAAGDDAEIMVDFHGKCGSIALAVQCIEAIAPYRPMFAEEPIQPGDSAAMRQIAERVPVPIATGERLVDRKEFEPLCQVHGVAILQPDICHCGGLLEAKKIAAMAETAYMGVAPHNPLGPIAGAAALHFAASTPNFVIQEEMVGAVPWYDELVQGPIRMADGFWDIPDTMGLGVEVNEAVAAKHPFCQEALTPTEAKLADGTVVDW